MAGAIQCLSSCFALPSKFRNLSITSSSSTQSHFTTFSCLSFSANLSHDAFSKGFLSMTAPKRPLGLSIVCEAATKKKADSAAKRARQAEKRRLRNKARKSEVKTRMKKVLEELDVLKKKTDAQSEEILPIEKLIAEAYSAIDKAIKAGTLHRNTGARRKSRLARGKKAAEIHHGWYSPDASAVAAA
ncbi:40S ribosomal protein S20 [Ancistrocladus abbreviatus]